MKIVISLILMLLLYSCAVSKEVKTVRNYKIKTQLDDPCFPSRTKYTIKDKSLNGKYYIKTGLFSKEFCEFKDGYYHGNVLRLNKKKIIFEGNYNQGFPHGEFRNFSEVGKKLDECNYINGYLYGEYIAYTEDGCDTSFIANMRFDKTKAEVYTNASLPYEGFSYIILNDYINCGLIDISKYPIRFYQKNDSTLITTVNYYKHSSKYYTKKQLKDLGIDIPL